MAFLFCKFISLNRNHVFLKEQTTVIRFLSKATGPISSSNGCIDFKGITLQHAFRTFKNILFKNSWANIWIQFDTNHFWVKWICNGTLTNEISTQWFVFVFVLGENTPSFLRREWQSPLPKNSSGKKWWTYEEFYLTYLCIFCFKVVLKQSSIMYILSLILPIFVVTLLPAKFAHIL